jgi:hypothetical protein
MASFAQGALLQQFTSTVASESTTTLTASSTSWQRFTADPTIDYETVVLPDATTLKLGREFIIENRTNHAYISVESYGTSTSIARIEAGSERTFRVMGNGTAGAGDWVVSNQVDLVTPLSIHAGKPAADAFLYIDSNQVYNSEGSISSTAPADDVLTAYAPVKIKFDSGASQGDVYELDGVTLNYTVKTQGGDFTRPTVTSGQYTRMAMVYQSATNTIDTLFSAEAATQGALTNPGTMFASMNGTPVGYVDLYSLGTWNFRSATDTSTLIQNRDIIKFGSGAGGGGAGGDTSFKIQSIAADGTTKIKGGYIALGNGKIIATYDGSGTGETDFGKDITIDLDNIITSPVNATTYYLYVDKYTLATSATTVSVTGRQLYPVVESNLVLLTTTFENVDKNRYLAIGTARRATGAWDTTVAYTYPTKREQVSGIIASPVVYSNSYATIGEVGITSGTTQGHLTDDLFPTLANVHYYNFDSVDTGNDSSGNTAVNLTAVGTPSYVGRGLFADSIVKLDGINQYFTSSSAAFNPSPSASYSFGLWAKFSQSLPGALMANVQGSTDFGYLLSFDSGNIYLKATGTSNSWDTTLTYGKVFPNDSWHHIAGVYDFATTTLKLYVDGVVAKTGTLANQRSLSSSLLEIGSSAASSLKLSGYVQDAFFVKGDALTDTQMLAIYSKKYANDQIAAGHLLTRTSFPSYVADANISWYALVDATDGSGNSRSLTPSGSPDYSAKGILGLTSSVYLNGSSNLSSTDTFFNPGDRDFVVGGWFKANGWVPSASKTLFESWNASNLSFKLDLNSSGNLEVITSTNGTTSSTATLTFAGSGWQHIVAKFIHSENKVYVYANSVLLGTASVGGALYAGASPVFAIGGTTTKWNGYVDEFFFVRANMSLDEIAKLYSYKIAHAKGISPTIQDWSMFASLDDINVPLTGVVNDLDGNDLYVDLSGQYGMASLKLVLKNADPSGAVNAVSTLRKDATAAVIDAALPISHNLPGAPTVLELWVDAGSGYYEKHDVGSYFKVNGTTIASSGTTLTSVLGGSTACILIASCGAAAVYSPSSVWNTVVITSTYLASVGDEIIADTTGGTFTVTLPSTPNLGDKIKFVDSKGTWASNKVTVSRNGKNIANAASDLELDVAYGWAELVYDGIGDWKLLHQ